MRSIGRTFSCVSRLELARPSRRAQPLPRDRRGAASPPARSRPRPRPFARLARELAALPAPERGGDRQLLRGPRLRAVLDRGGAAIGPRSWSRRSKRAGAGAAAAATIAARWRCCSTSASAALRSARRRRPAPICGSRRSRRPGVLKPRRSIPTSAAPDPAVAGGAAGTARHRAGRRRAGGLEPPDPDYRRLGGREARLERLAQSGRWGPAVADGPTLHPGDSGPRVAELRARLARLGYVSRRRSGGRRLR